MALVSGIYQRGHESRNYLKNQIVYEKRNKAANWNHILNVVRTDLRAKRIEYGPSARDLGNAILLKAWGHAEPTKSKAHANSVIEIYYRKMEEKPPKPQLKVQFQPVKKITTSKPKLAYEKTLSFYESREWLDLRYKALQKYGRKCMNCGDTPQNGAILHVDHIKPRSLFPELQLELSNLQILCKPCNMGKSCTDITDFRPKSMSHEDNRR